MYKPKPIDTSDVVISESEKEYDRSTSIQALKLIVRIGYKITKN